MVDFGVGVNEVPMVAAVEMKFEQAKLQGGETIFANKKWSNQNTLTWYLWLRQLDPISWTSLEKESVSKVVNVWGQTFLWSRTQKVRSACVIALLPRSRGHRTSGVHLTWAVRFEVNKKISSYLHISGWHHVEYSLYWRWCQKYHEWLTSHRKSNQHGKTGF